MMVAATVQVEWIYHIYFSTNTSQNNILTFIIHFPEFFSCVMCSIIKSLQAEYHYCIFTDSEGKRAGKNHEGLDAIRS